ncbi:hypothetical protein AVEN_103579-1, partial [Araneus ventricosus]
QRLLTLIEVAVGGFTVFPPNEHKCGKMSLKTLQEGNLRSDIGVQISAPDATDPTEDTTLTLYHDSWPNDSWTWLHMLDKTGLESPPQNSNLLLQLF